MKGMITGIKRMAVHDGDGIRTTVFFKGCPLECIWCHNPENISFQKELGFYERKCIGCGTCAATCKNGIIHMENGKPVIDRQQLTADAVFSCSEHCPTDSLVCHGEEWEAEILAEELLKDREFFINSGGGVTLSGGECLSQPAFAVELAKHISQAGISVDIDTCGYASPAILKAILPYTDTFLYDIKAISPTVHRQCTGKDNALILENLKFLSEVGARIEIRYPYVKEFNDGECRKIGEFLKDMTGITKVKVLGYHSYADSKYDAIGKKNTLPRVKVTADDVEQAVEILREYGLHAVNGMRED